MFSEKYVVCGIYMPHIPLLWEQISQKEYPKSCCHGGHSSRMVGDANGSVWRGNNLLRTHWTGSELHQTRGGCGTTLCIGTSWQFSKLSGTWTGKLFSVGWNICPQAWETEQALSGVIGSDCITHGSRKLWWVIASRINILPKSTFPLMLAVKAQRGHLVTGLCLWPPTITYLVL